MVGKRTTAALLLVLLGVASFTVYETYFSAPVPSCQAVPGGGSAKSQAKITSFGAVTEYKLPGLDRWPNAVTTAPDGSVWFAEQEVPGVAHLYPGNGTVVEYAWPGYPVPTLPDCIPPVSTFGIALWNGRVWGVDEFGNKTVGVNPGDGSSVVVDSTGKAPYPYWLAPGPDGALWFTSDASPARLGRIWPNMTLTTVDLVGLGKENPLQLDFVNSTLAFFTTVDLSANSTTHSCVCTGHVYGFDPSAASSSLTPSKVGGGRALVLPTSLSFGQGKVWVAQHGTSNVVGYDFSTRIWTTYPTSTVSWVDTTLPLSIQAEGGIVWFAEHYANKVALLDPAKGTLTEFSESNPPASGTGDIQNDESISAVPGGLWFTSMSGNYVGFVNASYESGYHLATPGGNEANLAPGSSATLHITISGSWDGTLFVNASDSEASTSIPKLIRITPASSMIPPGTGTPFDLPVVVQAAGSLTPGDYTVGITLTGGGIQKTVYFFLVVG